MVQDEKDKPFDLNELFPVRDSDSVYLFRENMPLDSTLPLTDEDIAEHRHIAYEGSDEVSRDPLNDPRAPSILDPEGDIELQRELRYGSPVPMEICRSKHHKGARRIPKVEFLEGDTMCHKCRLMTEFLARGRSTPEVSPRKQKWARLKAGKLTKGGSFR